MTANSMLFGFIYGSITGAVYKTTQNVYPQKVNMHTWDTVKPVLLLEDQLTPTRRTHRRLLTQHFLVNTAARETLESMST